MPCARWIRIRGIRIQNLIPVYYFSAGILRNVLFTDSYAGTISRGPLLDAYFHPVGPTTAGPFFSLKDFNDNVQFLAFGRWPEFKDPWRCLLPDSGSRVYFTHSDLHAGNLIISGEVGSRRLASIVDWEFAGWYPEWWEFCKMRLLEDREGWADGVFQLTYENEWNAFVEYWSARAP
jgi:hypothetical protein